MNLLTITYLVVTVFAGGLPLQSKPDSQTLQPAASQLQVIDAPSTQTLPVVVATPAVTNLRVEQQ